MDFDVSWTSITTDYKALVAKPGQSPFIIMDKMLDSQVHDTLGTQQMYLYYFTDREAFAEVDKGLTHPRIFGAYVADWKTNRETYFHELGHVLSLYHHFDSTENASKKEAHLSRPCLMNYRQPFVSDYFCPLCSYSLGIEFNPTL